MVIGLRLFFAIYIFASFSGVAAARSLQQKPKIAANSTLNDDNNLCETPADPLAHYVAHFSNYGQMAHVVAVPRFLKSLTKCHLRPSPDGWMACPESSAVVFLAGVEEHLADSIMAACPCALVHGFEMQENAFKRLAEKYNYKTRLVMNHAAVFDRVGSAVYEHTFKTHAGIEVVAVGSDANPVYIDNDIKSSKTTSFEAYAEMQKIARVDLAILDLDGFEEEAVAGMNLADNRHRFPAIMYTFNPSRARGQGVPGALRNETMELELGQAFEDLGYSLQLMTQVSKKDLCVTPALLGQLQTMDGPGRGGGFGKACVLALRDHLLYHADDGEEGNATNRTAKAEAKPTSE